MFSLNLISLIVINAILFLEAIPNQPGKCDKNSKGKQVVIKDREGQAKLLICDENVGTFRWKMIDGNSYGNVFDSAIDCSDIMNNLPKATTGVYWIKTDKGPRKAWCDMETDGGGFMLIGVQDSPVSWDVPSEPKFVHPLDSRRWSSLFGNMLIKDFRVQLSTSRSFSNVKADWYYRFNSARKLSQLLLFDKGGCSSHFPGVGDVKYVKDLRNKKIVTIQFQCSRFGAHFHKSLGWGKMNDCLGSPCNSGFAFLKLTTTGSFSFSVVSPKSGVRDNSTAFIGCDKGECCACYGPSSDKDYCAPKCQSINGGTVLRGGNKIRAWFWIRTTLPRRVWKKCMEYKKTDQGGKMIKWHVNENTGVPSKGPCSNPEDVRLNDGVAVVGNKQVLQRLPDIEGLLSYRVDNRKLYFRGKDHWKKIANDEEVQALKNKLEESNKRLLKLEEVIKVYSSCKDALEKTGNVQHGVYKIKEAIAGYANVYCHMTSLPGCAGAGWTLVMKIDGKKETFHYSSSYWSNKQTYNLGGGMTGFDDQESKLPAYWSTPFEEICLGMKVKNQLNFISIPYKASSLFSVLADGSYRSTSIGRAKWLSLIKDSGLQHNCNREGFNVRRIFLGRFPYAFSVRIGIVGNEQDDCFSPDSYMGFGSIPSSKRSYCSMPRAANTCGNSAYCRTGGNKEIHAMGYIFVR